MTDRPPTLGTSPVTPVPESVPLPMRNAVRHYDWGSHTLLAGLQGRPRSLAPEAELWMGAHPSDPSWVDLPGGEQVSLADLVAADPRSVLGERTLARFGPRLPFLLKVLAVERALSVQVHPDADRARRGFAAEQAAGAPSKIYVDQHAKPEFLYALTPFDALAGFRRAADVARLLDVLGLPLLRPVRSALTDGGVLAALEVLVHWPRAERAELAEVVEERCRALAPRADDEPDAAALSLVSRLQREHPGDPLVTAPLLMQLHRLPVGGTIYLAPGVPHAYLGGAAVEVMVASDNVLRAGLTTKPVAVEELLAALDPDADPVVGLAGEPCGGEGEHWTFPVPEFSLARIVITPGDGGSGRCPDSPLPHVLLCTRGAVTVEWDGGRLPLRAGRSVFVPAGSPDLVLHGDGEVFRAGPGPDHSA